jgi:hypothetical protein
VTEVSVPMTPQQYIEQLKGLVSSGQDRQAVELSARLWPQLVPQLSLEEIMLVSGLMEGAETALEFEASLATTDVQLSGKEDESSRHGHQEGPRNDASR